MRVDIHTHFIPPAFVDDARQGRAIDGVTLEEREGQTWMVHPQGYRYPLANEFFDLEAKLRHMDSLDIDVSVLSIAPTLLFYWLDAAPARDFCQMANEAMAEVAAQSDGRLYAMATVPLQDPEAAARELRRAVTELGHRGALIGTTMEDRRLDNPDFEPFFAAAEALGVPVVLHPYYVGLRPGLKDYYLTNLVGNPLETCVAAARLILSGFFDRHPDLDIVLVHAGGYMPYQIGRVDHGFRVRSETSAIIESPPSTYLRRFYFDTITHAARPLEFLIDFVGADRVVVGTDIPFDMADTRFADYLSEVGLDDRAAAAVNGGNAVRIFGLDGSEEGSS